ncbi:MAG: alpha-L-fucosidase [Clostridium sp.]|nr:alpha-L-fucosidase [Clostridium sp.]
MKIPILSAAMTAVALSLAAQAPLENANTIKIEPSDSHEQIVAKAVHVVPNDRQTKAMENEFIAFIHFGPNTFSRREWGTGFEDPKVFAPTGLDTDQWVRTMKDAGMKMVLLTVKHHDGFVLWQSRYTDHGIMSSDFEGGKGDILRDLARSCEKYGMKLGVYLSPADLYQIENEKGLYGNLSEKTLRTIPRPVEGRPFERTDTFQFKVDDYNEYFLNQLFELLTEYGPIHEVWFDGAHPKTKGGQTYDYLAWKRLIHTLAPEAVIFGREDMRWCGNEAGRTRENEWNVIPYQENPNTMTRFHDIMGEDLGSRERLYEGKYLHYQPAETDVSIRDGWFFRDDESQRVRSADDVFDMYERSTGGNSVLLLNIPPNRDGRFSARDSSVLAEVGRRIRNTYTDDLMKNSSAPEVLTDGDNRTAVDITAPLVIRFSEPMRFNRITLQEPVADSGERIEDHAVDAWIDGGWVQIANAGNIGYKRTLRFPDVTTDSIRIRVGSSRATPRLSTVGAYRYDAYPPELTARRSPDGFVTIEPKRGNFGDQAAAHLSNGAIIHYTTDGSEPTMSSPVYTEPFRADNVTVKAVSELSGKISPVAESRFGFIKNEWKIAAASGAAEKYPAEAVLDSDPRTFWVSEEMPGAWIEINLGGVYTLRGFTYTPQTASHGEGMIDRGTVSVSNDGKKWKKVCRFELGNLINDPTPREVRFDKAVKARFVRIDADGVAGDSKVASIAEIDLF